jgi:hypothetical protein
MPKPFSIDPDAQAFLTAAAITDPTISGAINTLVVQIKSAGIWPKMKAIYPLVGGTASTHKWNLKDPRDLNAAYRLQFFGGVTHNSNGITGNQTNAYANTFLIDNTLSNTSKHISIYLRNILNDPSGSPMGIIESTSVNSNRFYMNFSNQDYSALGINQQARTILGNQKGFFTMSKTTSGQFDYYRPGTSPLNVTGTNYSNNSYPYFILASNDSAGLGNIDYSLANIAFATIGDGLSNTEEANFRTAVIAFQNTLSRQV